MLPALLSSTRIFFCNKPTDMRKSFNGLENLVRDVLQEDPFTGHLFVFINKSRNRVKILFWDSDGYCLFYKKLSHGTFCNRHSELSSSKTIETGVLYMILGGIDISFVKHRKRIRIPN